MDILGLFLDRKRALESLAARRKAARKATQKIRVQSRIDEVLDPKSGSRLFDEIPARDPLSFPGYADKVADLARRSGRPDAFLCKTGTIEGMPVVCTELLADFMMGSMGSAVGEAVCQSIEYALARRLPLIIFSASGGARMQEGMYSLMQMAKTSAALRRFSDAGGLYISVLCHPTTGGVTASFAMLGDIILAEPGALIGFAGPRVIEQTINTVLPEGFQSAEFQRDHGFVDALVARGNLRATLSRLLRLHGGGALATRGAGIAAGLAQSVAPAPTPQPLLPTTLTPFEQVKRARDQQRPHVHAFIEALFEDFFETHGDRAFRDDGALVCGLATFDGQPVTVAGHVKGCDLNSNIKANFGMPHPEGYRKFIRACKQAEKFGRPIITFIDTPGAYPGPEAEERGQGEAIARCLFELGGLTVPVISIVTGEGGSGGALALSVCDALAMLEHTIYSVLSPEGFASILWKDAKRADEASAVMKLTAHDLFAAGMADAIIPEPEDDAEPGTDSGSKGAAAGKPKVAADDTAGKPKVTANDMASDAVGAVTTSNQVHERVASALKVFIRTELAHLSSLSPDALVARRYGRYRGF
jgi:acetyl-CoA carboxylase carboxyl transferase subunit beta